MRKSLALLLWLEIHWINGFSLVPVTGYANSHCESATPSNKLLTLRTVEPNTHSDQAREQLEVVILGFNGNKVKKKVIAQHNLQVAEARLIFYFLN